MKIWKILSCFSVVSAGVLPIATTVSCSDSGTITWGSEKTFDVTNINEYANLNFHWSGKTDASITFTIQHEGEHSIVTPTTEIDIQDDGNFIVSVKYLESPTRSISENFTITFSYKHKGKQVSQTTDPFILNYTYQTPEIGEIKFTGYDNTFHVYPEQQQAEINFKWIGDISKTIEPSITYTGAKAIEIVNPQIVISDDGSFTLKVKYTTLPQEDTIESFKIKFLYMLDSKQYEKEFEFQLDFKLSRPTYTINHPTVIANKLAWDRGNDWVVGYWIFNLNTPLLQYPYEYAKLLKVETIDHSDCFKDVPTSEIEFENTMLPIEDDEQNTVALQIYFNLADGKSFQANAFYKLKVTWESRYYDESQGTYDENETVELQLKLTDDVLPELKAVDGNLKCFITQDDIYDGNNTRIGGLKLDGSFGDKGGEIYFFDWNTLGAYKFVDTADPEKYSLEMTIFEPLDISNPDDITFDVEIAGSEFLSSDWDKHTLRFAQSKEFRIVYVPFDDEYVLYQITYNYGDDIFVDVNVEPEPPKVKISPESDNTNINIWPPEIIFNTELHIGYDIISLDKELDVANSWIMFNSSTHEPLSTFSYTDHEVIIPADKVTTDDITICLKSKQAEPEP